MSTSLTTSASGLLASGSFRALDLGSLVGVAPLDIGSLDIGLSPGGKVAGGRDFCPKSVLKSAQ